ncbi:hypothetical protein CANINC_004684 [Pichia inconspicua]|uniref:Zn(2)-C6 fungal-type domain-containing protein n=1 Tax=Pichia inconspicua TaxID=52247 RepID=A0A4T0WVY7_9ASCO|nr:hypothetical protein CANINC_004684 [[Candida] inconspicua]
MTKSIPKRVSKACIHCRQKKTRCLPSNSSHECLRCQSLNLKCSLQPTQRDLETDHSTLSPNSTTLLKPSINSSNELDEILDNSRQILQLLKSSTSQQFIHSSTSTSLTTTSDLETEDALPILESPINYSTIPISTFTLAPVNTISPPPLQLSIPPVTPNSLYTDIIETGILSLEHTIQLFDIFRDRYSRWVSFPLLKNSLDLVIQINQSCHLLISVCCLISLKFNNSPSNIAIYNKLADVIRVDLNYLINYTNNNLSLTIHDIQTLIILSTYSLNISTPNLTLNGLTLSLNAILIFQHLNTIGFQTRAYPIDNLVDDDFNVLSINRIWNTILLNHIVYTILTGTPSPLSLDILKPRLLTNLTYSTNFDYRIIQEIQALLIGYKFIFQPTTYSIAQRHLNIWYSKFNLGFNQPSNQFVEIDYHFIHLIVYIHNFGINVHNIPFQHLQNVYNHTNAIFNLINTINDDSYFAFLSDQIHLIIVYTIPILIQTMAKINSLLNKQEKEVLIRNLIQRYRKISIVDGDIFHNWWCVLQSSYDKWLSNS